MLLSIFLYQNGALELAILSVIDIEKTFGVTTILENINFEVQKGEHCGLIGINGSGKTTLFNILSGKLDFDSGNIYTAKDTVMGYMEQHVVRDEVHTAYREVMSVFKELEDMEHELETINHELTVNSSHELIEKQIHLNEKFADLGGLTYKNRVKSTLVGLGFDENQIASPVSNLSGGQKGKLQLAKMLLSGSNLLLLDEPTNHLDIESVKWLEDFLLNFSGAFIVISHDRYFLDRVCSKTLELDGTKINVYPGNYSVSLKLKKERKLAASRVYENTKKEIKRIEGIIEQQKRFNRESNYITIASKQKSIDRLESTLEKPESEPDIIDFKFKASKRSGNDVLSAENLSLSFGENNLFKNIGFEIKRKDKVFLLGPNGCGKTSLLKILLDIYQANSGSYTLGANIEVGYYDQAQGNLDESKTVIDEIWDLHPQMTMTEVRSALAVFLFKGEDVFKPVKGLSGGERARVLLLKLMLQKSNFLILDEPTNHLDISSREALEDALLGYDGTLLIVSHDRYLINKLSQKILYLEKDGVKPFLGNYDDFLEKKLVEKEVVSEASSQKPNNYKLEKDKKAEIRKLKNALSRCESAIEETELLIEETEELLSKPEITSDYKKALELSEELHTKKENLEALMKDWEKIHLELSEKEEV